MKIIQDSTEHHFLTLLDNLKSGPQGWIAYHFALGHQLIHEDIIDNLAHIHGKLHILRRDREDFITHLAQKTASLSPDGTICAFTDGDVILLARPRDASERSSCEALFAVMAEKAGPSFSHSHDLAAAFHDLQKLADHKLVTARRIAAYELLGDANRVHSIPLRRDRRDDGMVLLVEDDRFTASFIANIVSKDYDLVHSRTGEDALIAYIEHAPDIVLLDIHLPGLNGHEILHALKKADPDAAILMLSVDSVKSNIVGAAKGGALGFLKKPFSGDRLRAAIKKSPHLRGSKMPRRLS